MHNMQKGQTTTTTTTKSLNRFKNPTSAATPAEIGAASGQAKRRAHDVALDLTIRNHTVTKYPWDLCSRTLELFIGTS
jgi:hypothetical protein